MSRPNSSAPSRYLAPGLVRFSMRLCRAGSSGASHGASAALSARTTTRTRPRSARRFRQKRAQAVIGLGVGAPAQGSGARRSGRETARSSLPPHAGIEQPVGEVDEEIDDDEGEREDEHGPLPQDGGARETGHDEPAAE